MTHDESFDRDLRGTLEAMAERPAPERLVSRINAIPGSEPGLSHSGVRSGRSLIQAGQGFAALAAVLVIAAAVFLFRPSGAPGTIGQASSPPTTVPSAGQPSASQPATSLPAASVAASASSAPVPAGFEALSVTFVSSADGWLLGGVPCAAGRCAAVERTSDGGRTWAPSGAPPTTVATGQLIGKGPESGVTGLRFATPLDGWAYGPDLWSTHDGGASWARATLPVQPSSPGVVALGSAHGSVHVVFYDGDQAFRIASGPIGKDAWTLAAVGVPVGAGPVPAIQLVLSGDAGWVLENDRVVSGGARLVGGTWRAWQPPCANVTGPAALAASSTTEVIASCDVGQWSTPLGNHLFVSHNGGATFGELGTRVPITLGGAITTPDPSTYVVAGSDAQGTVLVGSFDGGRTWTMLRRLGGGTVADLGFTDANQGVVVDIGSDGSGQLFMTRDGGRTWSPEGP